MGETAVLTEFMAEAELRQRFDDLHGERYRQMMDNIRTYSGFAHQARLMF
ncbi:MAG: hypothetical protein ACXV7J_14770 [Methylomonas sp.]